MVDFIQQLSLPPFMLVLLIGIVALVESLALVGLLVPGVVLITAACSLAGHQGIAIGWMLAAAFTGAVSGDLISFQLGLWEKGRVLNRWPLSQHPEWIQRGQRFFARYGVYSVFIGRFFGPVRPIIPLVAGMMRMPSGTFLSANLTSALLWAPAYTLPGYWLGHTWQQRLTLPPGLETSLFTLMGGMVLLAVLFSWGRSQTTRQGGIYRWSIIAARRFPRLRRPWLVMSQNGEVPIASLLLLVICIGGFSACTLWVMHQQGPTPLDLHVQQLFGWLRNDTLVAVSAILARVGDLYGVLAVTLPWGVWMLIKGYWALLGHWLAAVGGIALLNTMSKILIGRERPTFTEELIGSMSYPSAHTSTTVVLIGLAAAFCAAKLERRQRFWAYWAAIALSLPMALSRLILNVHWLTDLMGGALLGLIVCAGVRLNWQQKERRPLISLPWVWLCSASLAMLAARLAWLPSA